MRRCHRCTGSPRNVRSVESPWVTAPMAEFVQPCDRARCLQIQDIALWESTLKRILDYEPARHQGRISVNRSGFLGDSTV